MNTASMLLLLFDGDGEGVPGPTRLNFAKSDYFAPGAVGVTSFSPGFRQVESFSPGFHAQGEHEDQT